MTDADEDLLFDDSVDSLDGGEDRSGAPWRMLVVDDEPEVHSITRLVLADFSFKGRPLVFLSAYSAAEARAVLLSEPEVAVILLDVVMETDDAGLKLVHTIRNEFGNRHVRIILRTGQPGQAPERAVILGYDINDYKAKSQLTAQQLFTTVVAALRSYEDIATIEANRRGLEKILEASSSLFQTRSMKLFAAGVLTQLGALIGAAPDAILCVRLGRWGGDSGERNRLYVLAGTGRYESAIDEPAEDHVEPEVMELVRRAMAERGHVYEPAHAGCPGCCALYMATANGREENVVYLRSNRPLSGLDQRFLEIFCDKIALGFDNLALLEKLRRSQESLLATLLDITDPVLIDDEGVHDSLLIASLSDRIAHQLRANGQFVDQVDEAFLDLIGLASILHDVGNIAVDSAILAKPGQLDEGERRDMERHTAVGGKILDRASRRVDERGYLTLGAEIARHHHENFDGSGYPERLAGDAIPLAARIVAVADTYDALISRRPYRDALSHELALAEIQRMSGRRFDPVVVEAFFQVIAAEHRLADDPIGPVAQLGPVWRLFGLNFSKVS